MHAPILATKLYVPPPPPKVVVRSRLTERLDEGLHGRLTLVSAPAGSGKSTLVSGWIHGWCGRQAAWLSMDEGDSDPARFLAHLVAALRTVAADVGEGVLAILQSPPPPPTESILTALLNEIATVRDGFVLVLDDYHVVDSAPVDQALAFLLEHLPPQMHLVIATREDPHLPLARLRARGELTELRAVDLRFTPSEAAEFLNRVMGLDLSAEDITALETRTEGWITGLQLAALSIRGRPDAAGFIQAFTGSHRFVLDYLIEEVLEQQSERVQEFLLRTSILDRLCGPLCDAVLLDPSAPGQQTLEYLEHANLFIVPLDDERHWYRYHHLFVELLRQRLNQGATSSIGNDVWSVSNSHIRASQWYEDSGLELEAFHHAAAANDVARAERLLEGDGIPLHFRGVVTTILDWLASLPTTVLDARPSLRVRSATLSLVAGQSTGVEEKLQAAEVAMQASRAQPRDRTTRPESLSDKSPLPGLRWLCLSTR
ncbi:MAG: AAA family ATPase [Thermoleophilia bacterium]